MNPEIDHSLIVSPWEPQFMQLVAECQHELFIACPFVKQRYARLILGVTSTKRPTISLVTRFNTRDFLAGASDIRAVELFTESHGGSKSVRFANALHAKIFVFDLKTAIVTSTNLSYRGFNANREAGIITREPKTVAKIVEYCRTLFSNAEEITEQQMAAMRSELQIGASESLKLRINAREEREIDKNQSIEESVSERSSYYLISPDLASQAVLIPEAPAAISQPPQDRKLENKLTPESILAECRESKARIAFAASIEISDEECLALFCHPSAFCFLSKETAEKVRALRVRLGNLGSLIREYLILKRIISDSPIRITNNEINAKLVFVSDLNYFGRKLLEMGMIGETGSGEFTRSRVSGMLLLEQAQGVAERTLSLIYLKGRFDALHDVDDVFFDFSEDFPYQALSDLDYKGQFQAYMQEKQLGPPKYTVVEAVGPDHNKIFKVSVVAPGHGGIVAFGRTKQMAETEAARIALERIGPRLVKSGSSILLKARLSESERAVVEEFGRTVLGRWKNWPFRIDHVLPVVGTRGRLGGTYEGRRGDRLAVLGARVIGIIVEELWGAEDAAERQRRVSTQRSSNSLQAIVLRHQLDRFILKLSSETSLSSGVLAEYMKRCVAYVLLEQGDFYCRKFCAEFEIGRVGEDPSQGATRLI